MDRPLPHGRNLGVDESHVMRDMAGDAFQESLEREGTGFRMNTSPLKVFDVGAPEDDGHLTPHDGDQFQLVMDAAFLIVQSGGKNIRITTEHRGIVFHQHPFHAIRINGLKVGDMADNLANGPLTRHRSLIELLLPYTRDSSFEQIGASFVLFQQIIQCHRFLSSRYFSVAA